MSVAYYDKEKKVYYDIPVNSLLIVEGSMGMIFYYWTKKPIKELMTPTTKPLSKNYVFTRDKANSLYQKLDKRSFIVGVVTPTNIKLNTRKNYVKEPKLIDGVYQ